MRFIYKTTNKVSGKAYVGMCANTSNYRTYLGSGKLLSQAIDKYGKENFEREILEYCDTEEELRVAEMKWIKYYNAVESNTFYNLHEGGRGGNTGTPPMSSVVQSTWDNYTEEERAARVEKMKKMQQRDKSGKNNTMYGRSAVKENSLKWYTDGTKNIYVTEGTEPEGFRRGRIKTW